MKLNTIAKNLLEAESGDAESIIAALEKALGEARVGEWDSVSKTLHSIRPDVGRLASAAGAKSRAAKQSHVHQVYRVIRQTMDNLGLKYKLIGRQYLISQADAKRGGELMPKIRETLASSGWAISDVNGDYLFRTSPPDAKVIVQVSSFDGSRGSDMGRWIQADLRHDLVSDG